MIGFTLAVWPLSLLGIAAAALTWFTYRNSSPRLQGLHAWLLPSLRFSALFVLLALLFEPVLHRTLKQSIEPVLGILVDESQSMAETMPIRELPPINGNIRVFGFGSSLRPLDDWEAVKDTAPRTDIGNALTSLEMYFPALRCTAYCSSLMASTTRAPIHCTSLRNMAFQSIQLQLVIPLSNGMYGLYKL